MPVTSPVRLAVSGGSVCRSVAMRLAPGRSGAGEEEAEPDADQDGRQRIALDEIAHVLGHAAETFLLKVLAAALERAGNVLGGIAEETARRVVVQLAADILHPGPDPARGFVGAG